MISESVTTVLGKRITTAEDAQDVVRLWNMLAPLEENTGWRFLMHEAEVEARRQAEDILRVDQTELSSGVGHNEVLLGTIIKIGRWSAAAELRYLLTRAKAKNQEATRFLENVSKAREQEQ
jgi:hypothetical protein